ncbi:MAG: hypoxanthine phosphoribosyltransferase [Deltaproteobacteria bacterium]|jgi:hypoxanthine phosphoribosyltransferase|nr:hypoxanthine phosphoribosyltransferase [Deltaproteobacteria bacterium]
MVTKFKEPARMELVFRPEEIAAQVKAIASGIDAHFRDKVTRDSPLLVLGVLNGAFVFMADLIREIHVPLEVDFIRLSSYEDRTDSSQEVVLLKAPERPIRDRHLLVVEDIADCGLTLQWLLGWLETKSPASVRTAVLVDKRERREVKVELDYTGFVQGSGFLVGYGLDYAKSYRELPGIYRLEF